MLPYALMGVLALLSPSPVIEGRVVAVKDGDTLVLLVGRDQVVVRLAELDAPEKAQPYGQQAEAALANLVFGMQVRVIVTTQDPYRRAVGRVFAGATDVCAALVERGAAWVYRQYSRDARLLELEAAAKAAGRGLWALPARERIPPWEWRRVGKGRVDLRSFAALRQVIDGNAQLVDACYRLALGELPTLHGGFTVSFTIEPSGEVSEAHVLDDTLRVTGVAECAQHQVRSWRFPPSPGEPPAVVELPFVFSPTPEPDGDAARGFTCGTKTKCSEMASCDEAFFFLRQCGVGSLDRDGDGRPCEALCR